MIFIIQTIVIHINFISLKENLIKALHSVSGELQNVPKCTFLSTVMSASFFYIEREKIKMPIKDTGQKEFLAFK